MQLFKPSDIHFDNVTLPLIGDLQELAYQVNEIRPLSKEIRAQLKNDLLAERVYSSNAIEGNTLTIRETRLILQSKTFLDVQKKREAQEAINLGAAAEKIEQLVDIDDGWCDIASFLDLHEILMTGVNDSIAGVLRNRNVMITGARHQPPGSHEVSDLLDHLFATLREGGTHVDFRLAIWAHWAIARVHPFEDGNGRLARLWQDLLLLKAKLTVAIIRPEDRTSYLEALGQADEGEFNPLAQLVCARVMSTFQKYLAAQEAADELRGWAAELVGETSVQEEQRKRLEYIRWRQGMERLRDAFERCAAPLNRAGNGSLAVGVHRFDIIDQFAWERLMAVGGTQTPPFFYVHFRKHDRALWYWFSFDVQFGTDSAEPIEMKFPLVKLILGKQHLGENAPKLLDKRTDSSVSLREIWIADKEVIRVRKDPATAIWTCDQGLNPTEIARTFFEEVLLKELENIRYGSPPPDQLE